MEELDYDLALVHDEGQGGAYPGSQGISPR